MVSRENGVIVVSVVVAAVAWLLVETYTAQPLWVSLAVLIGVGIVLPTLVNGYLDRQGAR